MLFQKALKALDEKDREVLAAPWCPEPTRGRSCGHPTSLRMIDSACAELSLRVICPHELKT